MHEKYKTICKEISQNISISLVELTLAACIFEYLRVAKLSVYSGGRACNTRTMRRLVGRRGTIAVNNACDLCNKRLLHAQPVPRNSMLRNRSASEHRRRTCVPSYAISGVACTADVTCICACHYARRAARYISRRIVIFVDAA